MGPKELILHGEASYGEKKKWIATIPEKEEYMKKKIKFYDRTSIFGNTSSTFHLS